MAQNIEILIRAVDRATPAIRSTETALRGLGKTGGFVSDTLKFFAQAQVFGGLMALQTGLVGSVAAGVKFNSSMELARMRWTELTGSAKQGEGMVQMILRVAKETSFTTDQINNYATMLAGAGVKSKDLEGKLMGLANVTAKYGLTNEQAQAAIRGYTQAIGKGKISVEELNQMQENGIPIYQILRDELGLTSAEIQGAGKDAKTSALIIDFLNNKFLKGTDAIEAYGRTFAGRLDKMKDTFTVFAGVLAQPLFEKLKAGMASVTSYMDKVTASIQKGKGVFASLRDAMSPEAWNILATAMGLVAGVAVFKVLSAGIPIVLRLVAAVKQGSTVMKALGLAFTPIGAAVLAVSAVIAILVRDFMNAYKQSASLRVAVGQLGEVFKVAWAGVQTFVNMLVELANSFGANIDSASAWTMVVQGVATVLKVVITIIAVFADVLYSVIAITAGVVKSFYALGLSIASVAAAWAGDFTKSAELAKASSVASDQSIKLMSDGFKNFSTWEISTKVGESMDAIGTSTDGAKTDFDADMLAMKSSMTSNGNGMVTSATTTSAGIKRALSGSTKGTASMMSADLGQNMTALNQFQAKVDAWATRFRASAARWFSNLAPNAVKNFQTVNTQSMGALNNFQSRVDAWATRFRAGAARWFTGIGTRAATNFRTVNTQSMAILNQFQGRVDAWASRFRAGAARWFSGIAEKAATNFRNANTQSVAQLNAMQSRVNAKAAQIRQGFARALQSLASDARGKWNQVKNDASNAMSTMTSKVTSGASRMKSAMTNGIRQMASSARSGFNQVKSAITSAMSTAVSKVTSGASRMRSSMAQGVQGIVSAVRTGFSNVASAVSSGITRALSAITSKIGSFRSAGAGLISALTGGITSKMNGAINAVSGLAGKLRSFLPGSDAKQGALSDLTHSGSMLPVTFAQGIAKGAGYAVSQARQLTKQVDASLQSEVGARMFASGSSVTVYHRHDGTVNVNGTGVGQVDQFVSGSIGYEIGTDGVKQAIRSRTGGR